jgi:phosphomannomutase/phosphoglucomutase
VATKKPTRKQSARTSKGGRGNRSVLSFLYFPIALITLSIAAAGYFLSSLHIDPVNQRHRTVLIETLAGQYQANINNVLLQHAALMAQIASSPDVIEKIGQSDPQQRAESAQRIAGQVADGLSVHLFPLRRAQVQQDSSPPLSHAALDMIRRAEQGQVVPIEAHQDQGVAYLQSVTAVRNEAGRLIGTLAIAQSLQYLSHQLAAIDSLTGSLVIEQQFAGSSTQTLLAYGTQNSNNLIRLRSSNPNWTLAYRPGDDLVYAMIVSSRSMWLIYAALLLMCILPIVLAMRGLQQRLRHDASAFAKQLHDQQPIKVDFHTALFSTLAQAVNRVRMGKSTPTAAKNAQHNMPQSSAGSPMIRAGAQEPFEVTMIDSDNDLLGMQTAPATRPVIEVASDLFRDDHIGGIVGQALTLDATLQIGLAIGTEAQARNQQTLIVGRDGRLSSSDLAQALIRGLLASGRDVIDIGAVATPLCYFACAQLKVAACVMITGSHHQATYNGFRVVIGGHMLEAEELKGLYLRIVAQKHDSGQGQLSSQDVSGAYLTRIRDDVRAQRPLKVVIDCGNGIVGRFAPPLIKGIGCHVLPLFCDVDGQFPNHLADPSDATTLADLTRTVVETRADLGLAFDGDGDQLVVVSSSGKTIRADRLLMLLAKQVLQARPGATILFDVQSSRQLNHLILEYGGKPLMGPSGRVSINPQMQPSQAALAGEIGGHFCYQDRWYGFEDALYTASRLIEIVAGQTASLDALLDAFPADVASPEFTIGLGEGRIPDVLKALQRNGQFAGGQLSDIDGVRVDFADGWGLVHAAPATAGLTCRFEADTQQTLMKIQTMFKEQLLAVDSQLQIPF